MIDGEESATLVENSVLLHDYETPQANELPCIHRPCFAQPQPVEYEYI